MFFGYHCETTIIKNREQKQQKAETKKKQEEKKSRPPDIIKLCLPFVPYSEDDMLNII